MGWSGIDAELAVRAATAGRLEAIYALHRALPTDRYSAACDALVAEVACSLNLSHRSAWRLYDEAFMICQRRGLLTALCTGDIDLTRANDRHLATHQRPARTLGGRRDRLRRVHTTYQVRRWFTVRLPDGDDKAKDRVRGPARRDHPTATA